MRDKAPPLCCLRRTLRRRYIHWRRPPVDRCRTPVEDATQPSIYSEFAEHKWHVQLCLKESLTVESELAALQLAPVERGVTGVQPVGSPTVRRRELGALLRALRTERGRTAEQVAAALNISPSKLSRLETGRRGAISRDINDLCDEYGVDEEQRKRLLELAREGKQRAWWQPLNLPYSTYIGLEAEAASISDYGLGIIPGLLQTPDYARAMVSATEPGLVPEAVEQRVRGRMTRQRLLFLEKGPRFEAVVDESVLHRVVGSPAVMRAQLERLLELSELPSVTLRVIRYEAGALPAGNNKFIILSFAQPTLADVVFIEGLTGDLYLEDPTDIGAYKATYRTLVRLAADPEATRKTIAALALCYRAEPGYPAGR
jgi:transcriptional regulator with XRE-family HTH domain